MSRDKQTEIANDLNMHCVSLSEQFCGEMSCNACISNWLYNAGYRKSTDLAEEIFAEIGEELDHWGALVEQDNSDYGELVELVLEDIICVIAELKKKYIGKDTNVTTNKEEGK